MDMRQNTDALRDLRTELISIEVGKDSVLSLKAKINYLDVPDL